MKYMRVRMSHLFFMMLITDGNIVRAKCIRGLPEGAKFVGITSSQVFGIDVIVEHESFKELNDGDEIPLHEDPMFDRIE